MEGFKIEYKKEGDYLFPVLPGLEEESKMEPLGKYGLKRLEYLKEHQDALYMELMMTGELPRHLRKIQEQANERQETLVLQIMEREGITEKLKAQDWWKYVTRMNNVTLMAEELILKEMIYN